MSNKSLFEKLYEEVMQDDAEALGLPGGEDEGGGEDFGGDEGGDEVTLTLPRSVAEQLQDALAAALGGGEEEEFGGEGEEEGGEGEFGGEFGGEDLGSEDSEDEEEDSEDEEEDAEDEEGELKESPQSKYVPFETKGKADKLQSKSNSRVDGALANKTSAHGKASKTAQTQGTAHYMPFNTKYTDGKGSGMKVNNPNYNKTQGAGESMFG
jgi:hypothetical protein